MVRSSKTGAAWGTAWTYDKDADEEYIAIRTKAGLMDVSGLKKVHITGPHASHLIDLATRATWRRSTGQVGLCLHAERGGKIHRRLHPLPHRPERLDGRARFGHGHEELQRAAMGRDVSLRFDDNLHDCRCRGRHRSTIWPSMCRAFAISTISTTCRRSCSACRDDLAHGYTGERGYEIFCRGQDAGTIWDRILDEGKSAGIIPCRFTTLDMLRVESYLLFYPTTIRRSTRSTMKARRHAVGTRPRLHRQPGKTGFRGAEEHYRLNGKERFKIYGVLLDGKEPPTRARRSIATANRSAW